MRKHKKKRPMLIGDRVATAANEIINLIENKPDSPCLGPFFYDPETEELFGVVASPSCDCKIHFSERAGEWVKTSGKSQQEIWKREKAKGERLVCEFELQDVPRGQAFWFGRLGYVVMVGSWIEECPEAREKILQAFDLPADTIFKIDSDWGTSSDTFFLTHGERRE